MSRELSDCDTYDTWEQELPEPEEEDFFQEVVQNSLSRQKRRERKGAQEEPRKTDTKE